MKRPSFLFFAATIVLPLLAGACSAASESKKAPDGSAPASTSAPPDAADNEWSMPNKNYSSTRYSTLNEINADNVKTLKVAWTFSTGVLRGHEGGPLVVGNTMYVHTPFPDIVYALDLAKEGAPVKWKYVPKQDPKVIPVACCDTVNRGLAFADGRIFLNQLDATTVALDAETGKELWKAKQGDYKNGQTMTSAPMVASLACGALSRPTM
jgi:glucose dehydrogenase